MRAMICVFRAMTKRFARIRNLPCGIGRYRAVALLMLCAIGSVCAQRLPEGFFPESIAADARGDLYVGSAVQARIVRVPAGADAAEPFVAAGSGGLMSVQGLLVDDARRRLYACTGDLGVARAAKRQSSLLAFDLRSGDVLGRWPLPGGGFCNDLAATGDGGLLISDTAKPRILRFEPAGEGRIDIWLEHPLLGGADYNGNGIAVFANAVYLSTFSDGRLLRIGIGRDGRARAPIALRLPRPLTGADAVRALADGSLLLFENDIAGGQGRISRLVRSERSLRLEAVAEGLMEPVSGLVRNGRLIVVESQFRKLFGADKGTPPQSFRLTLMRAPDAGVVQTVRLPKGFAYPNGIAALPSGEIVIGSITSGRILARSQRGAWRALRTPATAGEATGGTLDPIFAATSLRLDGRRGLLWGTSPDFMSLRGRPHALFALSLRDGKATSAPTLPDGGFPNDLAIDDDGSVLVTDSRNGRVLRLAPGASRYETVIEDAQLKVDGGLGAAGIARAPDGTLVVGVFDRGELFVIERQAVEGRMVAHGANMVSIRPLLLPRRLEHPDGLAFDVGGALLVLEGAADSGDGRLLSIPDPLRAGRRPLQTLLTGLHSPVNLSLDDDGAVWITESKIRHRMRPALDLPPPRAFRLLHYRLQPHFSGAAP
jgi:sugar lactone lactonase YvrE